MNDIPQTERAIQLVGPDKLELNPAKPVASPGRGQLLAKVEAVGLCFSDLKLLKQFSRHSRKSAIAGGLDPQALSQMPNYVPGDKPTVPGHEAVVRIVKVGPGVDRYKIGERYLVETDYRWLPTDKSNAAFGYNFEGALQEYVLFDERVIASPDGESTLIPAPEDLSASALALIEPWACVENAYAERQRRTLKPGGRLLVAGETPVGRSVLERCPGRPGAMVLATSDSVGALTDAAYDDIVYFGANTETVEKLFPKLASGGLLAIVQCGQKFGRPVNTQVGRVHYGGVRVVGTAGADPAAAFAAIPASAEIRPGDKINIVGAAGPMGTMHVIRLLCQGAPDVTVYAGDLNDERLAALRDLAWPLARKNRAAFHSYNPSKDSLNQTFNYIVVMAPVATLAAQAVAACEKNAVINIFAGIPADTTAAIDLDAYVDKQLYFVGTSGSELRDMKQVLAKVVARELDTNLSVAAVSGLDGAIDGIRAVEKNLLSGKILVYPSCRGLKLTALAELASEAPLDGGRWSAEAEAALLRRFAEP
ncbi:MAG TPA: alcohol dehydrogenase catalytic domain-containing protein [Roseiarcus sp.]|nr:alcohol dehydrogenase catalytic domain-containing protein [Roseiarcus sp.]